MMRLMLIFPKLSPIKVKSGVFIGPDISKILVDDIFKANLSAGHKKALEAMEKVIKGFLGNYKSPDYVENVKEMVDGKYWSKYVAESAFFERPSGRICR